MKILAAGLQSHLDSGTTTLCHCWRLTLRSGEIFGFTDHDEAIVFDGTSFEAQAGFTGSEIESSIGLNVDNLEASGALQSGALDETRLNAGDYDHAKVEIWRVNWQEVSQRILQRQGNLGEVTYGQGHFTAEVRGLAHVLNQQKGRLFQFSCDADVGDARCGVNLNATNFRGTGTISAVVNNSIELSSLGAFADDWFTRGAVIWSGGRELSIKRHRAFSANARIDFWSTPKFTISVGDVVTVQAGCDKQFTTCQSKFFNTTNFRGCPHMPGSDFVLGVAKHNG